MKSLKLEAKYLLKYKATKFLRLNLQFQMPRPRPYSPAHEYINDQFKDEIVNKFHVKRKTIKIDHFEEIDDMFHAEIIAELDTSE